MWIVTFDHPRERHIVGLFDSEKAVEIAIKFHMSEDIFFVPEHPDIHRVWYTIKPISMNVINFFEGH